MSDLPSIVSVGWTWCCVLRPQVRLCNAPLLPADTIKLSFFLEAIPNLEKVRMLYTCQDQVYPCK